MTCQLPAHIALDTAIDSLVEPAYLVCEHGSVLFANAPARRAHPEPPPWLSAAREGRAERLRGLAHVVPLRADGRRLHLVLPVVDAPSPAVPGLPPWLQKVASLLGEGRSDKEIAAALGLKLSTVRTGVARIYRRTGAHSRKELAGLGDDALR